MPEVTCLHNLCTDQVLNKIIDKTNFNCKIHPNYITILNYFFIPLIFYNIINNGSYKVLFLLCLVRVYLDILDGSIARKCKMNTRIGGILDLVSDSILNCGICIIIFYYLYNSKKNIKDIVIVVILITVANIYSFISQILNEFILLKEDKKQKRNIVYLDILLSDNSLIIVPSLILLSKYLIEYIKK